MFLYTRKLCLFMLNASQRSDLTWATLGTLHAHLSWLPLGFILEHNFIELLFKLKGKS